MCCGTCPTARATFRSLRRLEKKYGVKSGAVNPNLFQDQEYKYGSIAHPSAEIRKHAVAHLLDSVEIGKALGNKDVSIWLADGSNYPGTQSMHRRIEWLEEALGATHAALGTNQRMLVEYKPFEPAFYHTDIADWGMALSLSRKAAGPKAKVLVDTGHHLPGCNIEQIVTWLLHLNVLGGFHFNDKKFADDDLTLGSIDPYQLFRIFHEILVSDSPAVKGIAYMIDQSHNLKGKMEAMVQSVVTAQELFAKASLVDHKKLAKLQDSCSLVEAEELFRGAFWTDVRPMVKEWRVARKLPAEPLKALKESGYVEKISKQRGAKNAGSVTSYA